MEEIYFRLGDFTFKIHLGKPSSDPKIYFAKNKMEIDLYMYLRVFIISEKPRRVDFVIEFKDLSDPELMNVNNTGKIYSPLFEWISETKILTYYQNNLGQFEIILKHALLAILKKNGGFGIHASVTNVKGNAYLFLGESGAGKSTTVDLLKDKYPTINDDITLIKRLGKKYYVFQTPFVEKAWWIKKTQKLYPVDKIFFLHKSAEFKAEPRTKNQELRTKMLTQIIAAQNPDKSILKNLKDFTLYTNNFYDLYFDKKSEKLTKLISRI